jgi:hypothetical protein
VGDGGIGVVSSVNIELFDESFPHKITVSISE